MASARRRRTREARVQDGRGRRLRRRRSDRAKDEERSRARRRGEGGGCLAKKKEDAIKHKQRLAKYPIPDVALAAEFEEEAAAKGVSVESLGYEPLPTPAVPFVLRSSPSDAALADLSGVFGDALKTPKGAGTAAGVRAVLRAPGGDDLRALYRALLKPCMEQAVIGKGRNALQWRRVLSDAAVAEKCARVLERKKVAARGAEGRWRARRGRA